MSKPSFYGRLVARIPNWFKYQMLKNKMQLRSETEAEKEVNALLCGYPSNHEYKVIGGQLVPGFQLFERITFLKALYPQKIERLLDVGCCRGFFVFDIASRPECCQAVGIDVTEAFIDAARKVSKVLGCKNAEFHFATLDTVSTKTSEFGGPFDLILVLGLYHYLYFGSSQYSKSFKSHDEIFSMLARLCSGQVILSGRLEIERLPGWMKENKEIAEYKNLYNTKTILEGAGRWFDITDCGFMSNDSVYILTKK